MQSWNTNNDNNLEFALAVPVKTVVSVPIQCILMPGFDNQLKIFNYENT